MSGSTEAIFRPMKEGELSVAWEWAKSTGCVLGVDDAAALYASDPEGFFVAEVDGEMVALVSVINYSEERSSLGLTLVRPNHSSKDYVQKLMEHSLSHAQSRIISTDNGPRDDALRQFKTTECVVFESMGKITPVSYPDITVATPEDYPAISLLDTAAYGYTREPFTKEWTTPARTRITVVLRSRMQAGSVIGYATARVCGDGVTVGPIVAPTPITATMLTEAAVFLLAQHCPEGVTLTTPPPADSTHRPVADDDDRPEQPLSAPWVRTTVGVVGKAFAEALSWRSGRWTSVTWTRKTTAEAPPKAAPGLLYGALVGLG